MRKRARKRTILSTSSVKTSRNILAIISGYESSAKYTVPARKADAATVCVA